MQQWCAEHRPKYSVVHCRPAFQFNLQMLLEQPCSSLQSIAAMESINLGLMEPVAAGTHFGKWRSLQRLVTFLLMVPTLVPPSGISARASGFTLLSCYCFIATTMIGGLVSFEGFVKVVTAVGRSILILRATRWVPNYW